MKKNYVSQMELLKSDWSMSMIHKLLPSPELAPNPLWPGHAPMKLWSVDLVLETMQTEEYDILFHRYQKRSKACKEAAKRKAISLQLIMADKAAKVYIPIIPDCILRDDAIANMERYYINAHKSLAYCGCSDAPNKVVVRWVVNYIRHNLVKVGSMHYDKALRELAGQVGKDNAYNVFKYIVLDKIAVAYPYYKRECERQKQECKTSLYKVA